MSNVWRRARLRVLLIGFVVLVTLANPEAVSAQVGRTRVYATFVSHNDESTSNVPCAWVSNDRDRYVANRAAIVELAQTIVARAAAWDFQSLGVFGSRGEVGRRSVDRDDGRQERREVPGGALARSRHRRRALP